MVLGWDKKPTWISRVDNISIIFLGQDLQPMVAFNQRSFFIFCHWFSGCSSAVEHTPHKIVVVGFESCQVLVFFLLPASVIYPLKGPSRWCSIAVFSWKINAQLSSSGWNKLNKQSLDLNTSEKSNRLQSRRTDIRFGTQVRAPFRGSLEARMLRLWRKSKWFMVSFWWILAKISTYFRTEVVVGWVFERTQATRVRIPLGSPSSFLFPFQKINWCYLEK